MFKEICIIVFIILLIIFANSITQQYLDNTSYEISSKLEKLYEKLNNEESVNYEELDKLSNELEETWNSIETGWTLIVLHSELDLIDIALSNFKTAIENKNLDDVYLNLKELQFLITHIPERNSFKLKNIF